ncbi:lysozyme inhibitor LprI family protein [Massilia sp. DD77]|uniref:lysozyme inhibitor LprI family protein n=1 Tax=Massilia sp. DD77 TaxID=3109349 RepID=UPI002FFEDD39
MLRRFARQALPMLLLALGQAAFAAAPYPNTSHFGVPFSEDEAWHRQCRRVEQRAAPGYPLPGAGPAAPCDAGAMYYAKRGQAGTSAAEWKQVRACALARGDHAVLAMLYANGFGVERDLDVAIHHACSMDNVAKAEMEGRVAHLAGMHPGSDVFDQCDDITSGAMGTVCAGIRETRDERVREARLDRLARSLPHAARASFGAVRAAAERYVEASAGERDMQGTGAPGFVLAQQGRLREQFMQAALDAVGGKLPRATPAQAQQLDRELNRVYREVMALPSKQDNWPDRIGDSTISRADIRTTERRWIAYRDAFTAFAAENGAGSNGAAVEALLTRQRIAALRRLAGYR